MGVHGLTTLLRSSAILPPPSSSLNATTNRSECLDNKSTDKEDEGGDEVVVFAATFLKEIRRSEKPAAPLTLAVDGNGLAFRLLRIAHASHCRNLIHRSVEEAADWTKVEREGKKNGTSAAGAAAGASLAVRPRSATPVAFLPSMLPLSALDDSVNDLLSSIFSLGEDEGVGGAVKRIRVFYDGPEQPWKSAERSGRTSRRDVESDNLREDCHESVLPMRSVDVSASAGGEDGTKQSMKSAERSRRALRRDVEWDNLRQYCLKGVLPMGCVDVSASAGGGGKASRSRSMAQSGRKKPFSLDPDAIAGRYLDAFPSSSLFTRQVRASLERWSRLHPDRVEIVMCEGEADADLARASADDGTGRTVVVGEDSDFLVFGYDAETVELSEGDSGEVLYLPFDTLESLVRLGLSTSADDLIEAALRRTKVAAALGLPDSDALLEASIVLGNDYTKQFVRCQNKKRRQSYRKSLRWAPSFVAQGRGDGNRDNSGGWSKVDWDDARAVIDHFARAGPGQRVTSTLPELQAAIEYSRSMYAFCDVSDFSQELDVHGTGNDAGGADNREANTTTQREAVTRVSPSLPPGFDLSLASTSGTEGGRSDNNVRAAALRPFESHVSESEGDESFRLLLSENSSTTKIQRAHLDAFRSVLVEIMTHDNNVESASTGMVPSARARLRLPPTKLDWNDVCAAFAVERCVAAALRGTVAAEEGAPAKAVDATQLEPRHLFDPVAFHALSEEMRLEDFPLDNDIVSLKEKSFADEFATRGADAAAARSPQVKDTKKNGGVGIGVGNGIGGSWWGENPTLTPVGELLRDESRPYPPSTSADTQDAVAQMEDADAVQGGNMSFAHEFMTRAANGGQPSMDTEVDDTAAGFTALRCRNTRNEAWLGDGSDRRRSDEDATLPETLIDSTVASEKQLASRIATQDDKSFADEFVDKAVAPVYSQTPSATCSEDEQPSGPPTRQILPIDEHEEEILRAVAKQRVTIIQGETGCGKSSRVPVMLLRAPPPEPTTVARCVKMFVSQPRRIAAKSLAERVRSCEPDLRDIVALRMGHGVREHETRSTRLFFVTTGYLVRLLANHPESFTDHSHLIIDEVHERSVDTDILCLLCRRLLTTHPTIRLVLMSATMAASMYSSYFGTPEPPIFVGARRYKINEYFVEDLCQLLHLGPRDARDASNVYDACEKQRCRAAPPNSHMNMVYSLAMQITLSVGRHGSSVLIFVPGMADIEAITEKIEDLNVPGISYTCLPIHSDVPFEEQMVAFDPPGLGEVKVILATNAAESSVTLPDVDHVICLGLCKQIVYNRASHRQMLVPCWISRASATQRAGRTGRVREGNVYRLYSRNAYTQYMEPFEAGEMMRIPLDSVILSLRDMLNEEITPILLDCLEPPDITNIERSFESLHEQKFISEPNDEGELTSLGALAVSLGVDLTLGALVGLGIQFGIASESIAMAAILSFPKSPWLITNPLYHEAKMFNDISSKTFVSRCRFDAKLYSEPLAIMNLLWDYQKFKNQQKSFCRKNSVSSPRLRRLASTVDCLRSRVAEKLNVDPIMLQMEQPPASMCHAKITLIRVLQVWLFSESIITSAPSKRLLPSEEDSYPMKLSGPFIMEKHLEQVLDRQRHPFSLSSRNKVHQFGEFSPVGEESFDLTSFDTHFMSFVTELQFDVAWYCFEGFIHAFIADGLWQQSDSLQNTVAHIFGDGAGESIVQRVLHSAAGVNRRGRRGRACGLWSAGAQFMGGEEKRKIFRFSYTYDKRRVNTINKSFISAVPNITEASRFLSCVINQTSKDGAKSNFSIISLGQCEEVSRADISDLFSTPHVTYKTFAHMSPQTVVFEWTANTHSAECDTASQSRPLLEDIPEGARLLSVLASGRRRDHFIRFSDETRYTESSESENELDEDPFIDIDLTKATKISQRWSRMGVLGAAFVPENCVPAVAVSCKGPTELFACCANSLEVRGGGIRVEGITLLPPGRLFLALACLSFGIRPFVPPVVVFGEEKKDEDDTEYLARSVLAWVDKQETKGKNGQITDKKTILSRVTEAIEFNLGGATMGEDLKCYPDKVKALCKLFDGVDGYAIEPWDNLHEDPLTVERRRERKFVGYRCQSCAKHFGNWGQCRLHMVSCVGKLSSDISREDCMVYDDRGNQSGSIHRKARKR